MGHPSPRLDKILKATPTTYTIVFVTHYISASEGFTLCRIQSSLRDLIPLRTVPRISSWATFNRPSGAVPLWPRYQSDPDRGVTAQTSSTHNHPGHRQLQYFRCKNQARRLLAALAIERGGFTQRHNIFYFRRVDHAFKNPLAKLLFT